MDYPQRPGVLRDMTFHMDRGEIVGLVGQSGSGKTTLALAMLRLLDHTGARNRGTILLEGSDLMRLPERDMRNVRGRQVALVPQSASSALNPALRVGTQLREAWKAHSRGNWQREVPRIMHLLDTCGLPQDHAFLRRYPDQISLGQAQRVLIVMAVLHGPSLLIADEPTSALDVVTQRQVLELLKHISRANDVSTLLISHDLSVVAALCDRILILHDGSIVESGPVRDVLSAPSHPYTRELVAAVKSLQLGGFGDFPASGKPAER